MLARFPHRPVTVTAVTGLTLVLGLVAPSEAYQRPGRTDRVSVAHDGSEADGVTYESGISADGRLVAFGSVASNLVPGDTNEVEDIFVRDRSQGAIERVSVSSSGEQADDTSYHAKITPDGRVVAFASHGTNLVAGDTNGLSDVFVHDRATGTTERVSVSSSGVQANRRAFDPAISADGRFVAFISGATNLVPNDTNGGCDPDNSQGCDVFVHDRATGTTERVSVGPNGEQGNGPSGWRVDISADGRYVTFYSWATTFVSGDRNNFSDIFVKDRQTGNIERVSVASDGTEANAGSLGAAISDDGRYVAFYGPAPNLVPTESNPPIWNDVFVHDRVTRSTERVSVSSTGLEANDDSYLEDISGDGRYVTFTTDASNLVPNDMNGARDVLVHDRVTRTTERVAAADDGTPADDASSGGSLNPDGRLVVFGSRDGNLVSGDGNGLTDVFVRDRGPAAGVGGLDVSVAGGTAGASGWASFTGVVAASAVDPPSDGTPGANEVGAEIVEASLIHRPEESDLLFRLRLASLPGVRGRSRVPGTAGAPGVHYQLEFLIGPVRYAVRAFRFGAQTATPGAPVFELYRRDPGADYVKVADLSGGFGTTGEEILVSVPLPLLPGTLLTGLLATTNALDAAGDGVNLGNADVAPPTVRLGVAPAGTPEDEVAFEAPAALAEGRFSGTIDVSGLTGEHDVRARACLGGRCGTASVRVQLG